MRKKYLSALLFGALLVTSAGTFTSCKDYDDDINNLQEQIDKVVSDLESLKTTVEGLGGYVTDVKIEDGKLLVTVDGGTPVSYELPAGAEMAEIKIENGHLYVGNEDKGEVGGSKVEVNEDGVLVIDDEATEIKVGNDVVIKDSSNGVYTIQIGDETIQLPMASANITIEFTNGTVNYNKTFSQIGINDNTNSGIIWGAAQADNDKWAGPKGPVSKGQLLVGQMNDVKVRVTPATFDFGSQTLKFVDSKGNSAPVVVKAVATDVDDLITGTTRAANSQGEWQLLIEMTDDVTAQNAGNVFANSKNNANVKYALSVNGKLMTDYDYMIDTDQSAKDDDTYQVYWNQIKVGGIDLSTKDTENGTNQDGSVKAKIGETEVVISDPNIYDYYIAIAKDSENDAEKYGVKLEGNKIIAGNGAAGKTINFNVRVMDVRGNVRWPDWNSDPDLNLDSPIKVTFGKTQAGDATALDEVNYTITPKAIADKFFVVDLGNAFSGLTASEAVDLTQVTFALKDNSKFITKSNLTVKYYSDSACKNEVKFDDKADNIRNIKFAKLSYTDFNTDAEFGTYTVNMTMSTALGEYKKFEIPVNVSAPKFEDLFDKSAAWKDNNVILTVDQTGKALSMPAYKLKNDAEAGNLSWEISDGDLAEYKSGAVTAANLQLKADAFTSDHKIKTIAVSKAIYTLNSDLPNLTVESSAFTVTLKSLLEGAKLVNYVDGVEVPFATNTSELIVNRLELANLKPADLKDKDGAAFVISNTDYVFGNANTQKFYLSNKSGVYYLNETGYTFSFDSKAGEEATFSLDDKKVTITGLAESYTTTLTIKVNDVVVGNKYKETTIEVPVTRNK